MCTLKSKNGSKHTSRVATLLYNVQQLQQESGAKTAELAIGHSRVIVSKPILVPTPG